MKKLYKGFALVLVLVIFLIAQAVGVSADKYQKYVISDDFKTEESGFLAPGDYDGNGIIEQADEDALKSLVLVIKENAYETVFGGDAKAIYSDVNGDGVVDVRDLVMLDQNSKSDFIADGVMRLNGNSAFGDKFFDILGTGAQYEIKYSYNENAVVTVKLNGLDNLLTDSTTKTTENGVVTVTRNIKTPLAISDWNGIELQLIGEGEVQSFSVTRVNMDNEIADMVEW